LGSRLLTIVRAIALVTMISTMFILPASPAMAADPRYFSETGFRIADDQIWDYFQKRGGINQFGFPVSRKFQFMGSQVQFFQRRIVQIQSGGIGQINLLDPGFMPYTNINGATFPANDANLVKTAPAVGSADYAKAIQEWIKANAPETSNGKAVKFYSTYANAVTFKTAFPDGKGEPALLPGMNLEMWGAPTSAPAVDPKNNNFIYQRFQRGIMHYDAASGSTQGLLLADYFKSIITGQNLPGDLDSQAKGSPFYKQYDNSKANGLARPDQMPNSNLKDAFEKDQPVDTPITSPTTPPPPVGGPTRTTGLRYGMQGHLLFGDRDRAFGKIKEAGFGWAKQQIRWSDYEKSRGNVDWGLLDGVVGSAQANGTQLMFSVVTSPAWSRSDGKVDGPPNDLNDLGNFLAAMAGRYKGRVQAYEVWNEQNFSREWGGGTINAGAYVELLKVAYPKIKAADPNAIVISGALTPTGVNDPNVAIDDKTYLNQMYQYQGGVFKNVADAVGAHMAGYNNAPEDWVDKNTVNTPGFKGHPSFYFRRIDDLYSVMSANGDNRQMWLTEYHWAAASPPVPAGYEWTTHLSEQQVADFFVRSIQSIKAQRPWVGAIFVWNLNWRTFSDPHTSETAIFGILNSDWSGRLIYNRLKDMPK
jgi:polysaccharide biosynthesis protein PslG